MRTTENIAHPRITVLMPVYNAEKFVAAAIESILAQTYDSLEFLVIDDHSTDESAAIISSFCDPRIRLVVNARNEGITASLNKGVELAKGELIARMDADDISHPLRLEKQVAYMLANPDCAMLSTSVRIIDEDGRYRYSEGTLSKYLYYNLFFECCIYHSTVMFRKDRLQAAGGYRSAYAEDFELFQRIAGCYPVGGLDEPLLDYRLHPANTSTAAQKEEYKVCSLDVLRQGFRHCLDNGTEVPLSFLECFRYNFEPLLSEYTPRRLEECLALLDRLSRNILSMQNPNNRIEDTRYMWQFRKKYILNGVAKKLPPVRRFGLWWRWDKRYALKLTIGKIKNIFKKYLQTLKTRSSEKNT